MLRKLESERNAPAERTGGQISKDTKRKYPDEGHVRTGDRRRGKSRQRKKSERVRGTHFLENV
jgi:hypothetical protein